MKGELLGDVEGLREELLDLTRTVNDQALLLRELVHTKNRDDVLKVGVLLQGLLNGGGHAIVLVADDTGIEGVRRARQRVDCRVDAEGGDATRQNRRGVKVRERRGRSRVGKVVGGDVDGLDRSDRAFLG